MKKTKKLIVMLLIVTLAILPGLSRISFASEEERAILMKASSCREFIPKNLLEAFTKDVVAQYHEEALDLVYMP